MYKVIAARPEYTICRIATLLTKLIKETQSTTRIPNVALVPSQRPSCPIVAMSRASGVTLTLDGATVRT